MNKSLIVQVLLSLLSDGEPLAPTYVAALDILLPEQEKGFVNANKSLYDLLDSLQSLTADQKITLVLRALLLGLRLQDPIIVERSKRLAAHLTIEPFLVEVESAPTAPAQQPSGGVDL